MANRGKPRVMCAWCGRVIEHGVEGVSHGMCDECVPGVLEEVDRLARERVEQSKQEPPARPEADTA